MEKISQRQAMQIGKIVFRIVRKIMNDRKGRR